MNTVAFFSFLLPVQYCTQREKKREGDAEWSKFLHATLVLEVTVYPEFRHLRRQIIPQLQKDTDQRGVTNTSLQSIILWDHIFLEAITSFKLETDVKL